ncbi:hypothetical protein [Pseudomonas sp.]|uniref:hypothetical protein n=1 Tax=Pseudomonas sp. TaxID=306 RepID=UPI003D6FB482
MIDKEKLKALAEDATGFTDMSLPPDVVLALLAEIERLQGLQPVPPPRPPEGDGLPRYGLRWNGPSSPLAVPMEDGYWTPWHLADQFKAENGALRKDAERYRWLCDRFGITKLPCAVERILGGEVYVADGKVSIDAAVDAAMQEITP